MFIKFSILLHRFSCRSSSGVIRPQKTPRLWYVVYIVTSCLIKYSFWQTETQTASCTRNWVYYPHWSWKTIKPQHMCVKTTPVPYLLILGKNYLDCCEMLMLSSCFWNILFFLLCLKCVGIIEILFKCLNSLKRFMQKNIADINFYCYLFIS